jgi:hypothetical protein
MPALSVSDSDIKVTNAALSLIGIPPIVSFIENSATADAANRAYADTLEAVISLYPWRFAQETATLVRVADVPPYPWEGFYQLPSDAKNLRTVYIGDFKAPFDVFGRLVAVRVQATSSEVVKATYSVMVNPSEWPGYFREAFIMKLAARLSLPLTMDFDLSGQFEQRSEIQLRRAKSIDAQGRTQPRLDTKAFIRARRTGGRMN